MSTKQNLKGGSTMREMKAAVIGAGSSYTPELIEGFIDRKESLNFTAF